MTAHLVAGLAFGDEGKGATTDALVRQYSADLVIRYNGGAQCAHNVVTPSGVHHTFAQFGSGTFIPGCRTYLSQFVLVNPGTMLVEELDLQTQGVTDAWSRMFVHKKAVVTTPYQISVNRLQEMDRGNERHGSTGMGIGVTREDHLKHGDKVLMVEDLYSPSRTRDKLRFIRQLSQEKVGDIRLKTPQMEQEVLRITRDVETDSWVMARYYDWYSKMRERIVDSPPPSKTNVVFEGAQGMLLDEEYGFKPHTTWSDITFNNANRILREMGMDPHFANKIGVLRTYFTRHGAGPFPSENPNVVFDETHNKGEDYTGAIRKGDFDLPMTLYSLKCIGGVDSFAINHMDAFHPLGYMGVRISKTDTVDILRKNFLPMLTEITEIPVKIVGNGPTFADREFK